MVTVSSQLLVLETHAYWLRFWFKCLFSFRCNHFCTIAGLLIYWSGTRWWRMYTVSATNKIMSKIALIAKICFQARKSSKKKSKQASLTKLSNKRLNKLAKQGKLKNKIKKKDVAQLVKSRLNPNEQQLENTEWEYSSNLQYYFCVILK